jgi:hypothetical protein
MRIKPVAWHAHVSRRTYAHTVRTIPSYPRMMVILSHFKKFL